MEKEKSGKILARMGLAMEITGIAMTMHHRISYKRWHDGKNPCHGRAGLVLTGIGAPLLIVGTKLSKRRKN